MEKNCLHCNVSMEVENPLQLYCSSNCKVYHHRITHKPELPCYYCGETITTKSHYKFCSQEHKRLFFQKKRYNKPIVVRVNSKTIIETKKYDKIPELLQKYKLLQIGDKPQL